MDETIIGGPAAAKCARYVTRREDETTEHVILECEVLQR